MGEKFTGAKIGEGMANLFARAAVAAKAHTLPAEADIKDRMLQSVMERAESTLAGLLRDFLANTGKDVEMPEEVRQALAPLTDPQHQWQALLVLGAVVGMAQSIIQGAVAPTAQKVANHFWFKSPVIPSSPENLAASVARGILDEGTAGSEAKESGLRESGFTLLTELNKRRLEVELVLMAVNRGTWTEDRGWQELRLLGFPDELRDVFFRGPDRLGIGGLRWQTPALQDFIRFAAREVFEPAERARLGIDSEFPPAMAEAASRLGISEQLAQDYWAAHWDIPSVLQGFEMFQRQVIDRGQLEGLFRAAEIPPLWRDRLLEIAYVPFTRVDIRRMYKSGELTEAEVHRAHRDIGYDDEKAAKLTAFVVADSAEDERALAKTEIMQLVEANAINADQAREFLGGLGYPGPIIELILGLGELRKARRRQQQAASRLRTLFVGHKIDELAVQNTLSRLGFAPDEREELVEIWSLEREANLRTLTPAEVRQALRRGLIDRETAVAEHVNLGYTPADAELLVEMVSPREEA